jgi:uncharacterized protein with HEPN domain
VGDAVTHTFDQVDDDIVWTVVEQHSTLLHQGIIGEIETARSVLQAGDEQGST